MLIASWVGGTFLLVVGLAAAVGAIAGRRLPGPVNGRRARIVAAAIAVVTLGAGASMLPLAARPTLETSAETQPSATASPPPSSPSVTADPTPTPEPTTSPAPAATAAPGPISTTRSSPTKPPTVAVQPIRLVFVGDIGRCEDRMVRAEWGIYVLIPQGNPATVPVTYQWAFNGVPGPVITLDLGSGVTPLQQLFELPRGTDVPINVNVSILAPVSSQKNASTTVTCPVVAPTG